MATMLDIRQHHWQMMVGLKWATPSTNHSPPLPHSTLKRPGKKLCFSGSNQLKHLKNGQAIVTPLLEKMHPFLGIVLLLSVGVASFFEVGYTYNCASFL